MASIAEFYSQNLATEVTKGMRQIECVRRLIVQHTRRDGRVYEHFAYHGRGNDGCTQGKALPIAQVEHPVTDCCDGIVLTGGSGSGSGRSRSPTGVGSTNWTPSALTSSARRPRPLKQTAASSSTPNMPTPTRDLFLRERCRLTTERARLKHEQKAAATDLADLEQRTQNVLDLLQDVLQTYQQGTEAICKQLNHALFARILLGYEPA